MTSNTDAALSWCETHLARNGVLQRDGRTWLCSSPTREDRNPSLSVDIQKRVFRDHGTGEAGTISELAGLMGVEPPQWEPEEGREGKDSPARAEGVSSDAARLWRSGKPAGNDQAYIVAKKIDPFDMRVAPNGRLLIPGYDAVTGSFRMVQTIAPKPDESGKWPKRDVGPAKGALWLVGNDKGADDSFLVIAEGPSTAATIKAIFPEMAVACSFGTANLEIVYTALRSRFPSREIIVASDSGTEDLAARCKGALSAIPSAAKSNVDWNDVALELGSEEARRQFTQKLEAAREKAPLPKKPVKWEPKVFTATDLYKADIPEREWSVDDLVPAGLSVLASPPKMGKSWMALQMCLAVASGRPFLGMQTHKGPVLYVSLEDSPLRLRKRIAALVGDMQDIPANLHLMTELPRLDKGGMDFLEEWIRENKPRLVCLDTWGKIKPGGDAKKNAFDADYSIVAEVKGVADKYAIALLLIHHLKKGGGKEADFLESLNGSMGLPAAADAILALKRTRGESTAVLQRSGRDIEHDDDLALSWEAPGWKAETVSVAEIRMSEERREIIKVIRDAAGEPVSSSYIAETLGKNRSTTKNLVRKMVREGMVKVSSRGQYYIPPPEGKNDDDESVVSVVPVVRRSPRSLCSPRSPDGPETTADYSVVQSVVRSESSPDAGSGGDLPSVDYADYADYDKGQNFSEVKRMEQSNPEEIPFPRGSVSELAKRSGVSIETIRESLKSWVDCGRLTVTDGGAIYEQPGNAYPKKDLPEEAEEPDAENFPAMPEDEFPMLPEAQGEAELPFDVPKGNPEKLLLRGASAPGPLVDVETFPDPLPLPYEWPGHGWIIRVDAIGNGERSFVIARGPTGKPVCALREPKRSTGAVS